jgi:hypothetical protein
MQVQPPEIYKPVSRNIPGGINGWEIRTFNRHCVIAESTASADGFTVGDYLANTRRAIRESLRPNFLRGLALGTVLEFDRLPPGIEGIADGIDRQQRERIVWQWAIIASKRENIALGIHTWMHVYTTSAFELLLARYQLSGYQTANFKVEKDKLVAFLSRATGLE